MLFFLKIKHLSITETTAKKTFMVYGVGGVDGVEGGAAV